VSSPEVVRAVKELLGKEEVTELCTQCKLAKQACAEERNKNEEPSPDLESLRSDNESLNHQCEELRQELAVLQNSADSFHSDNAKLQVTVATLQSQVSSLSTQHTALQLANSQLVAEKDEVKIVVIYKICFLCRETVKIITICNIHFTVA
jgi:predicted nuclease with TOPRIM domain